MQLLGLISTLAILFLNIWGLMLAAGLYWRNRWFALAAGPILWVSLVYAVECHVGLGRTLGGLCLAGSALSAGLICLSFSAWEPHRLGPRALAALREWRLEFAPVRSLRALAVAAAVFLYALGWRFVHPDIDGSSEKIADLSYIASYASGATIPVPDAWLYPYLSTQYYSFQYYGAALLGRLLSIPNGTTYNISFCVLITLSAMAFAGTAFLIAKKRWVRLLVLAGFVIGGSGMTLIIHLTDKDVNPWTSMRFIGSAQMDKPPLGPWIKKYNAQYALADGPMELPGEPFSYSIYLGDYHPPLSGYYLLGLEAMGLLLWMRTQQSRYLLIAGATLTWTLLANTWNLPLQGLLVVAWIAFFWRQWRSSIPAVALGAAAVLMLSWVYLSAFMSAADVYSASLRLVPRNEHTPPLEFLLFLLPTIALIALGYASGERGIRWLSTLWLSLLLFTEFFFVDDVYSGKYDRFNTTLKWWPWVMAGTLMTLGPSVLELARRRWVRVVAIVFCLYPCFYVGDLWRPMGEMLRGEKESMGKMEGTYFLTKDEFPRLMLAKLKVEKPGIVVERPDTEGGFVNSAVIPLFAGQRMWLGWFGHELLWHGYPEFIRRRHTELESLYNCTLPLAGQWLEAQGVDYVLWYRPGDTPQLWQKMADAIGPGYVWCNILTYQDEDGRRVGYWKRIVPARR